MESKIYKLLFIFIFSLISSELLGQFGQFDDEEDYKKEFTFGLNFNTQGALLGGAYIKFNKKLEENIFRSLAFEVVNIKHKKEEAYTSNASGSSFVWGKTNSFIVLRCQYGREKILYRKAPQQGVQINFVYVGGLNIGMEKPYYIINLNNESVQYDPNLYPNINSIVGKGDLFDGIGNSKFIPGINAKAGLIFEIGKFRNNVTGIELGIQLDLFIRRIEIIKTQENYAFFNALYLNFFWGNRH